MTDPKIEENEDFELNEILRDFEFVEVEYKLEAEDLRDFKLEAGDNDSFSVFFECDFLYFSLCFNF